MAIEMPATVQNLVAIGSAEEQSSEKQNTYGRSNSERCQKIGPRAASLPGTPLLVLAIASSTPAAIYLQPVEVRRSARGRRIA
jgi:hypothetical protein